MNRICSAACVAWAIPSGRRSPPVRQADGVYALGVEQALLGMPVFGGTLTFTYQDGALRAADGVFYPESGVITRVSEEACISCADALTQILASRDALGWVGSQITGMRRATCTPRRPRSALRLHASLARRDGHDGLLRQRHHSARSVRPNEARLRSTLSNLNRILRKLLLDCHFFFTLTRRCGILSRWPELAALVCIATAERRASANTDFGAKPQIIPGAAR